MPESAPARRMTTRERWIAIRAVFKMLILAICVALLVLLIVLPRHAVGYLLVGWFSIGVGYLLSDLARYVDRKVDGR